MATVGTAASAFDQYRNLNATISGIVATGTTPIVRSQGFAIGSWQATGLTATGLTAQLTGSNDGVHFYVIDASARSADGIYGLIASSSTYTNIVPVYFQWIIGGVFGSGSVTIVASMMSTFG